MPTASRIWIHGLIRKGLPFDEDSPLAYGSEIRNPDIGPFRACADVNQLRARTRDEAFPSRLDINSVDRFTAVLHAQMTILRNSKSTGTRIIHALIRRLTRTRAFHAGL